MKLTKKDAEFLVLLKELVNDGTLAIEMKEEGLKRFTLRRNYGSHVERVFKMTRQGIRWRFQRLFEMYIEAYSTILWVESNFETGLRRQAMSIAKQRAEMRKKAMDSKRASFSKIESRGG
jgi:hypothetical protein